MMPVEGREHYMACNACGQEFDMRDLAAVLAHEQPGHSPIDVATLPIMGGLGRLARELTWYTG